MLVRPLRVASALPLERAADRIAGTTAIPGNRVEPLFDGPDNYAAMHALIAGARTRIHLENYIIRDDATGEQFAEALINRAQAGVAVRVLHDWLGSFGTSRRYWDRLRAAGVEVASFGPPSWRDPLVIFARNHRKLLVVDGERAVTGGLCIGDEWVGDRDHHRLPWRDTAVAVDGPACRMLEGSFARAWSFAGGAPPNDAAELAADVPAMGDVAVRVVATEPGRERNYRAIDLLLGVAAERLWITEAYLAAPQRLYQGIIDAARDGVDVRLLLPGTSDLSAVRNLSRVAYRGLLRAGVRIWEWQGPMLHAKTMVVDGRWVRIGSSNLNPSSLLANWELDLLVDDERLATRLEHRFLQDLSHAGEVVRRPRQLPGLGVPVPAAIERRRPADDTPLPRHDPSGLERRRRFLVTAASFVQGARAAVFGPLAGVALLAGLLFLLFPVPAAYTAAVLSLAFGAALVVRAAGHRSRE
jgi:cardiolipin synthase